MMTLITSTQWAYLLVFLCFVLSPHCGRGEAESKKRAGAIIDQAELDKKQSDGNSSSTMALSEEENGTDDGQHLHHHHECKDQFSDAYCKTRLLRRGKQYCKRDFYFGRMQCCGTCAKAWGFEPSANFTTTGDGGDSSNNGTHTGWTLPCSDHVGVDGQSLTKWCEEYAAPAMNNTIFGCMRSNFVKYRCMKTCGLC